MVKLGDFQIGNGRTFIIAELSANHGHSLDIALQTISAAKAAGADAIKLQTYTPDTLTLDVDNEYFRLDDGTLWDGQTLHQLYQKAYTPWEWHRQLMDHAKQEGLICFSTPFDPSAVDFLESLDVPAYKIASFEINDIPLIEYAASKGKPMIMSTGMATLADIEKAIRACRRVGNDQIVLLKCTSAYPASVAEANLLTIPNMKETFGVRGGLSDHTMGSTVPIAAVALGADVIEKHFIMDRSIGGPDADFSMSKEEFSAMVSAIRDTELALGRVDYDLDAKKRKNIRFSRSLFITEEIKAGEILTQDNVRSVRPGFGLAPDMLNHVLGKKAKSDISRGTPLKLEHIDF